MGAHTLEVIERVAIVILPADARRDTTEWFVRTGVICQRLLDQPVVEPTVLSNSSSEITVSCCRFSDIGRPRSRLRSE